MSMFIRPEFSDAMLWLNLLTLLPHPCGCRTGERSGPTNPFHPPGCSRLLAGRCLGGSRRAGEVGVFGMIGIERPSVVRHAHALSDRRTADVPIVRERPDSGLS